MTLRIFNPEHDMALAADTPNWTSPHAGRQLRADLGWIPALWAEDGDIVIVDDVDAATNDYRRIKLQAKKKDIIFLTLNDLSKSSLKGEISAIDVWGWDRAIKGQIHRAGINDGLLPTEECLDTIKEISGRQLTTQLMPYLRKGMETHTCGETFIAKSLVEILDLKSKYKSVVIKSPWSCSGRGVRYLLEKEKTLTDNQEKWILNQLRQQHEMMVEPLCQKVIDFGMEFSATGKVVEFLGLSLFSTTNGAYTGNNLATEEEKREMLSRYVSIGLLDEIQQRICSFMSSKISKHYTLKHTLFGVDMMICYGANGETLLNPCIELNFRRTMGHTALALSPQEAGHKQIMRIGYEGKAYHLRLYNNEEIFI